MAAPDDSMVTIAILVSRVEALCFADMLNAEGIFVHISGDGHASVQLISLALGGYRIWVPASQYQQASDLIRETGSHLEWTFSASLSNAVLRVASTFGAMHVCFALFGVALGTMSWWAVAISPLTALNVPVNPQGRGDYYLAPEAN